MNQAAKKWVKALRSGKYKQTEGQLAKKDSFCCLGVACELAKEEGIIKTYIPANGTLPRKVADWLGLASTEGSMKGRTYQDLTEYNDTAKFSFTRIANLIEMNPKGLFVE